MPIDFQVHINELSIAGYLRHPHPASGRPAAPVGAAAARPQHLRVRSDVPPGVHAANRRERRPYSRDTEDGVI